MSTRGSRFGFRAAVTASSFPRRRSALRPATDTIFAQRPASTRPASAGHRTVTRLPTAALLVAVAAIAAALVRRAAMVELGGPDLFRFNAAALPAIAGVLTLLVLSGRRTRRGRALASLAIAAALCPMLVALGGPRLIGIALMLSGGIAFATLPVALDWVVLQGTPGAARAAALLAAAQIGLAIGNASALTGGAPLLVVAMGLVAITVPVGLMTASRRRPEPDFRPSLPAIQAALGSYPMIGLIVAGAAAATATQLLATAFPVVAMGGETVAKVAAMILTGALVALVAGGVLADRLAKDDRGYARWFVATLGLAGLAALYALRLELVPAGLALLLACVLPLAGVGAAIELIFRLAPPPARLGALIAFLAARMIGPALAAPIVAQGDPGTEVHVITYCAVGLIIAAVAVAATMPRARGGS